ncbi:ORC1-type DNA replication protein [Candidatus Woesearchaeota archaeon]|nr:ORC1-type DNA replication protein [Candidatus Woesearchaeota archaeon]MBW3013843.1 ORC1-type DNA replication protein [Candidatus Woesearchaeota archaeon]
MSEKRLINFFEKFLEKEPLFKNKKVLQSDYTPESIKHREDSVNQIAEVLAPALRLDKPSNLFLYGKTGTGKTVTVKFTTNNILEVAKSKEIPIKVVYINCKLKKVADTEYRLIAELIRKLGGSVPATGLPTEEVYKQFFNMIDTQKQILILVLDEIDQLVDKIGDEILYSLTRINSDLQNAQVSIVGISNDLIFANNLDPRIKSSLSEEELVFAPYNALQLKDILHSRATVAFKPEVITNGVIEKCAAYAAREHGDARRALELLRVAGEIAERKGFAQIEINHLDDAEHKIEKDRIIDSIDCQPKQFHLVLYSIFSIFNKRRDYIHTGEVYDVYKAVCLQTNQRPLTQRRVSDIIGELDMLGIINAKTISKGRYGRTRDITVSIPQDIKKKIDNILKNKLDL